MLPGSSQRRHSSMARIHSMTIEAPITKVGFISFLFIPPSLHHMISTLFCSSVSYDWTLGLLNCHHRHQHFLHSYQRPAYHVKRRWADKIPHFMHKTGKHTGPEWPAFLVVYIVCCLDRRKQRKSPGIGHMTHCSSFAVSFDCVVSPCRRHPLQNKALIELLLVLFVYMCKWVW